jgi:hypothetical protein
MLPIVAALRVRSEQRLVEEAIQTTAQVVFKTWSPIASISVSGSPDAERETLSAFLRKLQEKRRATAQQQQAAMRLHRISIS